MIIARIALADLRRNWARFAIGIVAVGAALATVAWALGTVATARAQHQFLARDMAATFDAWVLPDRPTLAQMRGGMGMQAPPEQKEPNWGLTSEAAAALSADERIENIQLLPIARTPIDLNPAGSLAPQGPRPTLSVAGTAAELSPYGADNIEGRWLRASEGPVELVVSTAAFWSRRPSPGDHVSLITPRGIVPSVVVGLIKQRRGIWGLPNAFVSSTDYEAHFRDPTRPLYDVGLINLRQGADSATFAADWLPKLKTGDSPCRIETTDDLVTQLDDGALAQFRRTAPLLLGLSGLAAIVIIVTTLSLGIRQRIRMLALLRSVGASRGHVYALTLLDGVVMAALGIVVGLAGGWLVLRIMAARMPAAFPAGAVLGAGAVRGVVICGLLGVVGAALLPSFQAARMRPLDILQGIYTESRPISAVRSALGVLLMLPAPVLATLPDLPRALRANLLLGLGLPAIIAGCSLLTPMVIGLTERIFAGPICRLVGVETRLLRAPLTRQMGRVAGAAVTVSLALGLYIAIETWGRSLTKPFLPSPGFPDVMVNFLPNGLATEEAAKAMASDGFAEGRVFPIDAAQFMLADETQAAVEANEAFEVMQNNVLVLGVDVGKAFGGSKPMLNLPFSQGNARDAVAKLQAGGACVVPRTFTDQSRLKLGDKVGIRVGVKSGGASGDGAAKGVLDGEAAAEGGSRTVWLEIAGVIDANWHLVTARSGVRGRDGSPFRTLATWFVSHEQAREITPASERTLFLWGDLSDELRRLTARDGATELQSRLGAALGGGSGGARRGSGGPVGAAPLARVGDPVGGSGGTRRGGGGPGGGRPLGARAQVSHRDIVSEGTSSHASDIISNMSRIPLWALGILSLSVVSAMVASVQVRRREFGNLRAMGLSRSQLLRLVLVEGLLIGIAACLISLLFGIETGWCFTGYTRSKMMFGGMPIAFQIPWRQLGLANGIVLALSLAAALIPALRISRRGPAELLSERA